MIGSLEALLRPTLSDAWWLPANNHLRSTRKSRCKAKQRFFALRAKLGVVEHMSVDSRVAMRLGVGAIYN